MYSIQRPYTFFTLFLLHLCSYQLSLDEEMYSVAREKKFWVDDTLVIYDFENRMPRLAIEKLDCSKLKQVVTRRTKNFVVDHSLNSEFRISSRDYAGFPNIDRGHLAPAGDFKYSVESYAKTFTYSNVFPQNSKLNRGAWYLAERLGRDLVNFRGVKDLYVYSGNGFFPKTGKYQKFKSFQVIGDHNISVPDFVYKIYFGSDGHHHYSFAFILNNSDIPHDSSKILIDNEVSIETIESLTGYVMPDVLKGEQVRRLCDKYDCHTLTGNVWLAQRDEYGSENGKKDTFCDI